MKIRSCLLKDIRGLPSIQLDFVDPVSGVARPRTVLAGSNGSGKTTILEAMGQLIGLVRPHPLKWVAVEGATLYLVVDELPPDSDKRLGIKITPDSPQAQIEYINSIQASDTADQSPSAKYTVANFSGSTDQLIQQIHQAEQASGGYPNCIYFPSEDRQLRKKKVGQVIAEQTPYQWVYRFSDSQQWTGSLESFLVAMYFRDLQARHDEAQHANGNGHQTPNDEGEFKQFVQIINRFLVNKQIQGVDRDFRVQVRGNNGLMQSIDHLSSGEKQIILLLGELQRQIQHGSIVLIDEPEIHLHPKWQRQLMRALTDLCSRYDAQLIITTQSEEIAGSVYEHELILLDDIFESNPQLELVPAD